MEELAGSKQLTKLGRTRHCVELAGKPLLVHAVENVQGVVDEVVVCVNDEARKEKYAQILKNHAMTNVKISC